MNIKSNLVRVALLTTCFYVSNSLANCTYELMVSLNNQSVTLNAGRCPGENARNLLENFFSRKLGLDTQHCRNFNAEPMYTKRCSGLLVTTWRKATGNLRNASDYASFEFNGLNCRREPQRASNPHLVEFKCNGTLEEKE